MALRAKTDWRDFFYKAGIPEKESDEYADTFVANRITELGLSELNSDFLKELGITVIGDILSITRQCQQLTVASRPSSSQQSATSPPTGSPHILPSTKAPTAQLPHITAQMTLPQFRKLRTDWQVFKQITQLTGTLLNAQLYSSCDESVQNSILNTNSEFLELPEMEFLKLIEKIVTQRSNPTVYRMSFTSVTQTPEETIQQYLLRIKSIAPDCEFTCPNCNHDLQSLNVKDQFVRGLFNETLQAEILCKADQLKTLEDVIKYSEAFQSAQRDQHQLQKSPEVMAVRAQQEYKPQRFKPQNAQTQFKPCQGCSSKSHGQADRPKKCPAWGKNCHNCGIPNHFAQVCRKSKQTTEDNTTDTVSSFIAQVDNSDESETFTEEIIATVQSCRPQHRNKKAKIKIFPDSGANICLAGMQQLSQLNSTN